MSTEMTTPETGVPQTPPSEWGRDELLYRMLARYRQMTAQNGAFSKTGGAQ